MGMGFQTAGIQQGIGQGLGSMANMLNNHTMLKAQQEGQQKLQQDNPYVRLAAMKGMGQPSSGRSGATGSAADMVSSRINENYGQPGHPGGVSDPDGNFDPATMPLFGQEHMGMAAVQGGKEAFQKEIVPIANAYIQTKAKFDDAKEKEGIMRDQITKGRNQLKTIQAKLIAEYGPDQYGQTDEWMKARTAQDAQETRFNEYRQQMQGLEQSLQEYGMQLSQQLPGLDVGGSGVVAQEVPTLEHLQGGVRPPQRQASPHDIGSRIYPQGQIPASLMTRGYNPVTPHAGR